MSNYILRSFVNGRFFISTKIFVYENVPFDNATIFLLWKALRSTPAL